ncbi:hypothetical protein SDJN02_26146, partial [Cucurbita argyrosperma subsp. argyrosperma]
MGRLEFAYTLAALLFVLALMIPEIDAQAWSYPPKPLCSSQFALASYACARLPLNPEPLPISPPSSPHGHGHDHDHNHDHDHGHGHHRGHHHGHHHRSRSPIEEECCRWARQVDSECVCDALAHLANFMVRPSHVFTVAITEDCVVTYSCIGRIKI